MDFLKKFSNKRKMKYGAVLAGFLAILIAIILVFNALVSVLAERFNWYFDMTDEQIYSASDEFISAMEQINKNAEIEIVFLAAKDKIESDYSSVDGAVGLAYVHQTATQLAEKLDNITVSYHSSDDNKFLNQFKLASGDQRITDNCVIVMRTDVEVPEGEKLTQFELLKAGDFYIADSNYSLFAYNGEVKLVEASIRLTSDDEPTVYFVVNHDEGFDNVITSEGEPAQAVTITNLAQLYINAGYKYRAIDLSEKIYICNECGEQYSPMWDWGIDINSEQTKLTEVVDAFGNKQIRLPISFECSALDCDNKASNVYLSQLEKRVKLPSDARALVIYEPQFDFEESEIRLLEGYLSTDGTIMTFLDSNLSYGEMNNFYGFLKNWGGVNVHTQRVTDAYNSVSDGYEASVPSNEATSAYFPSLPASSNKPVYNNSIYLTIDAEKLPENANTGDQTFTQTESIIKTTNLASVKNATLMSVTNTVNTVANQGGGNQGNVDFSSYLMVCAGGDFADDDHIVNCSVNTQILRSLIRATTSQQIYPTDVEFKVFNSYDLDINSSESISIFVSSMTILPAISLIIGFIVIFRRKRR
ncbi:MAG: Gldg family protein [Clostridia bacterium]|nr:Gldg family protein [Clostridia bacterium]